VHVAAGVEVTVIYDQPALDLVWIDADHLDAEGAREAALEALLKPLRFVQTRSSAAPSS
jgi:hypothetical protein